jgi:serine/threonine protein kinase
MSLASGTRLGPYEIVALIGAGGMGEVYKARDTRLDRTVAIKVLPTDVAADPERRRRFEQEARAVSALNHPHICALFDVGEHVPSNPESRLPRRSPMDSNRAKAGVPSPFTTS